MNKYHTLTESWLISWDKLCNPLFQNFDRYLTYMKPQLLLHRIPNCFVPVQ